MTARWRKNPLGLFGITLVSLFTLVALLPGLAATHDPLAVDPNIRLLSPGPGHYFGTDELGRDVFSRVIYGTRLSLLSALVAVSGATLIGTALGVVAGYTGGKPDEVIMRISDVFISFPSLILAMALVAVLGRGLTNAMLAVIFVWWPQYARLGRGQVLVIKRATYVEAALSSGASSSRILYRHLMPNTLPVILVKASLDIGTAVLITAGLNFLGMGVRPPTPELGAMVTQGREFLLSAWWYATFPGLVIFGIVLGFNLVGDTLRDILDPTLR
ncbi:MAG: ABC transporter permease [Armatimonadetes bacterium]|nr:ABC transporter permease [Armatimonadota bacterium]